MASASTCLRIGIPERSKDLVNSQELCIFRECNACRTSNRLWLHRLEIEEWGMRAFWKCTNNHQRCEDRLNAVCVVAYDERRVYLSDTLVVNQVSQPFPFLRRF